MGESFSCFHLECARDKVRVQGKSAGVGNEGNAPQGRPPGERPDADVKKSVRSANEIHESG
jgi:hypothetical protein